MLKAPVTAEVAAALAWEFWRVGRARILWMLFLPAGIAILMALVAEAPVSPRDSQLELRSFYVFFWTCVLFHTSLLLQCRSDTASRLRFDKRLFQLPVATPILVGWKMVLPMLVMFFAYLATVGVVCAATGFSWPLWGPALVAVTLLAWVLSITWTLADCPALRTLAFLLTAAVLLVWVGARFGVHNLNEPTKMWATPTPGEILTLMAMTATAYAAAVWGVNRDRRGEALRAPDWRAALAGLADLLPRRRMTSTSPATAQFWFEWRSNGWTMPICAFSGLAVFFALNSWDGIKTEVILRGFFPMLVFLLVAFPPVIGALMGRFSFLSKESGIDLFRATRPLSDTRIAHILLKTGVLSLLVSWAVASVTGLAVLGVLHTWGDRDKVELVWAGLQTSALSLGYGPVLGILTLALVLAWTNMGLVASCFMTGRNWTAGILAGTPYALALVYVVFREMAGNMLLPDGFLQALISAAAWVVGGGSLIGAALAFVEARRRRLISPRTPWWALGFWLSAVLVCALYGREPISGLLGAGVTLERSFVLLGMGLLALIPTPLVAAPLAMRWNRHR